MTSLPWWNSVSAAAFAALLVCVLVNPALQASDRIEGILTLRDGLTSPGRPVRLEARLVHSGLLSQGGLGGEQIEFFVEGRSVGTAMTGGDGRAFLEYTPRMRGNQKVTARLTANKRVERAEAAGMLFTWERRRPLLIVEMVALAEPSKAAAIAVPAVPVEIGVNSAMVPIPDAPAELRRLTDYYYNVVYLSWTPSPAPDSEEGMRDWLQTHQFPAGLKLKLTGGEAALAAKLDELKDQGWDNVKAGVGRTRAFADVLTERRILAIVMPAGEREEGKLPRKAAVIKGWTEVRKKLQG